MGELGHAWQAEQGVGSSHGLEVQLGEAEDELALVLLVRPHEGREGARALLQDLFTGGGGRERSDVFSAEAQRGC